MANVYNIPSDKSFLDVLAISLLEQVNFDSNKLQEYLVLLPTRRACSALRDCFLKHSQEKALILPSIQPIGDILDYDDLFWLEGGIDIEPEKTPISSMKRLMILSNLVMEKAKAQGINMAPHTAYILSKELASILDEVVIENLSWDNLENIIPDNLNTYWQEVLTFLEIVSKVYPEYLKTNNLLDVKEYQIYKLKKLNELWKKTPPKQNVIAAGNTATQPVIADLLKTISGLDNGSVILPGLDVASSDDDFELFDEGHYQYGLKRFIDSLGITRDDVKEWGKEIAPSKISSERQRLIIETLKPVGLTQKWRFIDDFADDVLEGVYKLECRDERQEALSIALIMREVLETPEKTASLVTTDVNLGKRVSLELERFGIKINNSAGLSLSQTPIGVFFNLILDFCINQSPIHLLGMLKHPLCSAGFGEECRNIARLFEKQLQGQNKVYSIEEIHKALNDPELQNHFSQIVSLSNPLLEIIGKNCDLHELASKHIEVAQNMAINSDVLWQGPSGKANSAMFMQIIEDGSDFFDITLEDYAKLFLQFQTVLVRNPYNTHKRLEILGPIEARLQQKDMIILGSLNEGMFPKTEEAGPWMSYQMRSDFGLPSVKQKLGISASDFCNGFMAKEVYLTRSLKSNGTPAIASRWLQRLETVLSIAGQKSLEKSQWEKTKWQEYAEILDEPDNYHNIKPVSACPDIANRPKKISMSAVESLIKDPYSFYAKYILKVKPLKEIEPEIGAADYGSAVHDIISWFTKTYKIIPENGHEIIMQKAKEFFQEQGISLFWLTRFNRASKWLIDELKSIEKSKSSYSEIEGSMEIDGIIVTARADRIDVDKDNNAIIIDYKTGKPPTPTEVSKGFSPQLVIEALITEKGGFDGITKSQASRLLYYSLAGKDDVIKPIDIVGKKEDIKELLSKTQDGLKRLLQAFYKDGIPYEARPNLAYKIPYSDYEHLERVKEWASEDGEDGE